MKQHLNTLFVTTDGAYLSKDGQAVAVKIESETKLRVPIHHIGGIVCFGRVGLSPALMAMCAESDVAISLCTDYGRLVARVTGFTPGNVLLRRAQYRKADDEDASAAIARPIVMAKIANSRAVLLRAIRDYPGGPHRSRFEDAARRMAQSIEQAQASGSLDQLRGVEGEAANDYFSVFDGLLAPGGGPHAEGFVFDGRSRRPPRDNVNCLMSFLYSMLSHDARSACEAAGLDPQVGFLHRDRPGRPSLALDLVEELRAYLADRLVMSLINRRQVRPAGFTTTEAGGVLMDDETRKAVLTAYQKRKQESITHPFLGERTTVGLLVHLQARLLARYLRGEMDEYPAFIWR